MNKIPESSSSNETTFLTHTFNFLTPSNIKEMLLILIILILIYLIYENRQLYLNIKAQSDIYENKLKELVYNSKNCDIKSIKEYFDSKDLKNKAEENIKKFTEKKNEENGATMDKREYFR